MSDDGTSDYIVPGRWGCIECGETGHPDEQTLREHYEEEHDGLG